MNVCLFLMHCSCVSSWTLSTLCCLSRWSTCWWASCSPWPWPTRRTCPPSTCSTRSLTTTLPRTGCRVRAPRVAVASCKACKVAALFSSCFCSEGHERRRSKHVTRPARGAEFHAELLNKTAHSGQQNSARRHCASECFLWCGFFI